MQLLQVVLSEPVAYSLQVRFKYDNYPDDTKFASRLAVTINEFSIQDRVSTSQIHNLLYMYTSSDVPRQAFANMVRKSPQHASYVNIPKQHVFYFISDAKAATQINLKVLNTVQEYTNNTGVCLSGIDHCLSPGLVRQTTFSTSQG